MQKDSKLKSVVQALSVAAPWANLVVPIGLVFALGYFHFNHVVTVMQEANFYAAAYVIGACVWLLLASARVALIFATISDFSNGDNWEGSLGMLGSIIIFAFDVWFLGQICHKEFASEAQLMTILLRFLSALALIMEIRLVLLLWESSARRKNKNQPANNSNNPNPKPNPFPLNL